MSRMYCIILYFVFCIFPGVVAAACKNVAFNNVPECIDHELSTTNTRIDSLDALVGAIDRDEKNIDNRVVYLDKTSRENKNDITKLQSELTKNSNINNHTKEQLNELNAKQSQTSNAVDTLQKNYLGYNSKFNQDIDKKTSGVEARAVAQSNKYTDKKFNKLQSEINQNYAKANAGIAGAMAMTAIPSVNNKNLSFGMGMGGYNQEGAIAAGVKAALSPNATFSVNTSLDTENSVGVAAGISVGY